MRYLIVFLIAGLPTFAFSQVHIVDNNSSAPVGINRYTSLVNAVATASAGDTIYIVPSPNSYGELSFNKQLTVIGGGFNPETGFRSSLSGVEVQGNAVSSSTISSLYIDGTVYFSGTGNYNIENFSIHNNYIRNRIMGSNSSLSTTDTISLSIRGNIIGANISSSASVIEFNRVVSLSNVENNIIIGSNSPGYGSIEFYKSHDEVIIQNNIFLSSGTGVAFERLENAEIKNNIFYGRAPIAVAQFAGNTFTDNVSFGGSKDFPDTSIFTNNIDGGNNFSVDPQFVNLPITNSWSFVYNPEVQEAQLLNSTPHIGIFSGSGIEYFTSHGTILPTITSLEGPSAIIEGDDLQLKVVSKTYDFTYLNGLEYFIDSDPGFGAGTILNFGQGAQTSDTSMLVINSSGLNPGIYNIFVRAKNDIGVWGNYLYQTFHVTDTTEVLDGDISEIEYFFDSDPGYGLANPLTISSTAIDINIAESISTDGLTTGFHTLFIRAKDANGRWGIPESRLVFIDATDITSISELEAVEYFFDHDPGYGQANELVVQTPSTMLEISESISTDSLSKGFHTLFIRAMDGSGRWSIPESRLIYIDDSSTDQISEIETIEYFFDHDPGYGQATNLSVPTSSTFVEIVDNISTDSLSPGFHTLFIRAKNTDGHWGIPETRLIFIDEASTATVANVTSVEYYFDHDPGYGLANPLTVNTPADIVEIIDAIPTASLSPGFHTFFIRVQDENGRWSIPESRLIYIDANSINTTPSLTTVEYYVDTDPGYGSATQIPISPRNQEVNLKWNINGLPLGSHVLGIRVKNEEDQWSVTETFAFKVYSEGRELDSAALVEIYERNGGGSWNNRTNWLSSNSIDTWFGVTIDATSGRVTGLNLPNNNMAGDLTQEFGYLLDLKESNLSNNNLTDTIPNSVLSLINLEDFNVANNNLNGLPDLSQINTLNNLNLDSNFFEFNDIEPQIGIPNVSYNFQAILTQGYDSAVRINQEINLVISTPGDNNTYQWYKDSTAITGATSSTFTIPNLGIFDVGNYHVEIRNTVASEASLYSNIYNLYFNGPTADSLALVAMYDSLGGSGWTNNNNWLTAPLDQWHGISLDTNGRVVKIELGNNNLTGNLPERISDLTMVDSLILSGNNITGIVPEEILQMTELNLIDFSSNQITLIPHNLKTFIPGLTTLNVENNNLQFGPLESNLAIANFTYSPQDSILAPQEVNAVLEGSAQIGISISGANNIYQWLKNGVPITGANQALLTLSNLEFDDEGQYQVQVTNSLLPSLTIFTTNTNLKILGLAADQQALEVFYNTNGGNNWTNNSGWLTDTITNWHGVVVRDNRVVELNLPSNNIMGHLSSSIADLTAIEVIDLSGNELTDLPDLSNLPLITELNVSNNKLQFGALEPNALITGINYSPQDSIYAREIDTVAVHAQNTVRGGSSGLNNTYEWFYNGTLLSGEIADSIVITDITKEDMGDYYVKITNNQVPDLILYRHKYTLYASANISGTIDDDDGLITEGGEMLLLRITSSGGYDTIFTAEKGNQVFINNDGTYMLPNVVLDDYILLAVADAAAYPDHLPTYYTQAIFWEEADTLKVRDNNATLDLTVVTYQEEPLGGEGEIYGYVDEFFEDGNGKLLGKKRVKNASVSIRRGRNSGRIKLVENSRILNDTELVGHVKTSQNGEFSFKGLLTDLYYLNIQYPGYPMDSTSFIEIPIGDIGGKLKSHLEKVEVEALVADGRITVTQINVTAIFKPDLYESITLYPNPAERFFNIDVSKHPQKFSLIVYDQKGQILKKDDSIEGLKQIDASIWPAGTYIVRLFDENNVPATTWKVVLK